MTSYNKTYKDACAAVEAGLSVKIIVANEGTPTAQPVAVWGDPALLDGRTREGTTWPNMAPLGEDEVKELTALIAANPVPDVEA